MSSLVMVRLRYVRMGVMRYYVIRPSGERKIFFQIFKNISVNGYEYFIPSSSFQLYIDVLDNFHTHSIA